jgi:hypothetical protein
MQGDGVNCTKICPPGSCHPTVSCRIDEDDTIYCGDCPIGYTGDGIDNCTLVPQFSKSFGVTFPQGFRNAEKCAVLFSRSHPFNPSVDNVEVGENYENMTDHVDVGKNVAHLDLPTANSRDVTKVTIPLDRPTQVLGIVWERGTSDIFMSFPFPKTSSLRFIGVSVPTSEWVFIYRLTGFVYVVAEHDDTQVHIKPSVECQIKNNGESVSSEQIEHTLSGNTRLEITSHADLTGTEIISNKPVVVYSGHSCGNVPVNVSGCDQLVEQIPPVHSLGREFIVSAFERRSRGDYIKMVAAFNGTTISLYCGGYQVDYQLNALENRFHFMKVSSSCYINATKPILIAQFSVGTPWSEDGGDPSMAILPHVDQFLSAITFLAPEICGISGYNHFVNIYYKGQRGHQHRQKHTAHDISSVVNDITLDGSPIMTDDIFPIVAPNPNAPYFVAKVPINPGVHHISANSGSIAAIIYGANKFEYYSYSVFNSTLG